MEQCGRIPSTLPYSVTGWPYVVVRPWRDDVALAVAQQIEQALGGWQPPVLDFVHAS